MCVLHTFLLMFIYCVFFSFGQFLLFLFLILLFIFLFFFSFLLFFSSSTFFSSTFFSSPFFPYSFIYFLLALASTLYSSSKTSLIFLYIIFHNFVDLLTTSSILFCRTKNVLYFGVNILLCLLFALVI